MDPISEQIRDVASQMEKKAMTSLDAVTGCTTAPRVLSDVAFVRHRLGSPSRSMKSAAHALANTTHALKDCRHARVQDKLADAERAVRDVVVSRVQLRVPFGDRALFIAKLEEAFTAGQYGDLLHSQLMNAHRLTFLGIPGRFPSKSEVAGRGRGGRASRSDTVPSEASTCASTQESSDVGVGQVLVAKYQVRYYLVRPLVLVPLHLLGDQSGRDGGEPYVSTIDLRRAA